MNREETTRLCMAIATISPAQAFDDETPAFWQVILADVRYQDARDAVLRIAKTQRFIAPADILAEVKGIRAARLEAAGELIPKVDPDNVAAWTAELRALRKAIADGVITGEQYIAAPRSLTGAPVRQQAIEGPPKPGVMAAAAKTIADLKALETHIGGVSKAAIEAARRRQMDELRAMAANDPSAAVGFAPGATCWDSPSAAEPEEAS